MSKLIDLIVGARPNFMKIAPIVSALREEKPGARGLAYRIVHTGQHYDRNMSALFFEELGLPEPDLNLEVGSGTQAEQTGAIMARYEKVLLEKRCDACVVVGDVTSTMACSIVARKLGIPVAHVEGGIRSGDWTMPEEINRVVTDSITNWFFTTSESANANLRAGGVAPENVFFVGNTMIDTLLRNLPRLRPPGIWSEAALAASGYIVLTLHRPANVDDRARLGAMIDAVMGGARGRPVVFPVHPRTAAQLRALGRQWPGLHLSPPLGYLEFNFLVRHALAVITDSGGVTEETTVLGIPCLTLRDVTERPETVTLGTNELVGTDPARLAPWLDRLFEGGWKKGSVPPRWDGQAGARIVAELRRLLD
ncbi:MAG TPA: UDP-N-acetylglucosamine 2-epimerase (non-hydrolyzing) [Candidatus Didemnitutus sp.]|nr:UDP-N-acetylglucosamine 2-epimerase (non-hydrolyzing) [Candidatus Didemnitutus sp.]